MVVVKHLQSLINKTFEVCKSVVSVSAVYGCVISMVWGVLRCTNNRYERTKQKAAVDGGRGRD